MPAHLPAALRGLRRAPEGGGRRPRRRWLFAGAAWLAVVLVGAVLAGFTLVAGPTPAPRPTPEVVASVPYWNLSHATAAVLAHRKDITEVSPWMYGLDASGSIAPQYTPAQAPTVTARLQQLRKAGLPIVPSLANITGGAWSYQPVSRILHHQALMEREIAAIVALTRQDHYAGIDIDFENLHAGDRQAFSTFVTRLGAALHAHGKILSVALFAKTSDAGYAPRNVAQDYAVIGRAADQVRLMAYDRHWAKSAPGPVAPIGWVRDVVRYAKSQIPADKIILGAPLSGYDWSHGRGRPVGWQQAFRLSTAHHAPARYDAAAQSPWFSYTDSSGARHVVWFENHASSRAKFGVAHGAALGGVFLWMYGQEDPGTWPALHSALLGGGRAGPGPSAPAASAGGAP